MGLQSRFLSLALVVASTGCPGPDDPVVTWRPAFDTSDTGVLSSVWGSGPDDVFIVGGTDGAGEIYHFNGAAFAPMQVDAPDILVWVFGFAPDDVWSVGASGGVVHYNGVEWTTMDPGTTTDLWGVWGTSSSDLWIVGGAITTGDPVILHYDGDQFTPHELPASENPLGVHALFKIFGVGSKLFAVGQLGLIVEYDGASWSRVSAGAEADDDFVSLWGTSESNIVAVGGRNTARIAFYNGETFETVSPDGVFGLNAVFVEASGDAHIGGIPNHVYELDIDSRTVSGEFTTGEVIHAMWGDDQGRVYAVGGVFVAPFNGIALVRTEE